MEFTKMQKRILNKKPNGPSLIKGECGSGKTFAVVNKIPSLVEQYCIQNNDRVLVVSMDSKRTALIKEEYKSICKNKYYQSSFFDNAKNNNIEFLDINNLTSYYFNKFRKRNNNKLECADELEVKKLLDDAVEFVKVIYKKNTIFKDEYFNFIQDEIAYIKSMNYSSYKQYAFSDRKERSFKKNGPRVLRKNSTQRKIIFDIYRKYNENLKSINKIDIYDINFIAFREAKKKSSKKFTHIIVDNCEELTKIEFEIVNALYNKNNYSSITFLMDCSKESYRNSWIRKSRIFESLGYDMKGRTINLKTEDIKLLNNECSAVSRKMSFAKSVKNKGIKKNDFIENIAFDLSYFDIGTESENMNESKDNNCGYNELDVIEYIDLKRNVSHSFIKDYDYETEIYIKDEGLEEKVEDVCSIPVFNEIAAGSPILINDAFQDNYVLPKAWIKNEKDTFILKIKGDSMINKNIEDGDFVVIRKQNTAEIGDIVAVDIAGEATLKTYRKLYGKIALMPENEKYDPIMIGDQEFGFLGVAIGVIKNN